MGKRLWEDHVDGGYEEAMHMDFWEQLEQAWYSIKGKGKGKKKGTKGKGQSDGNKRKREMDKFNLCKSTAAIPVRSSDQAFFAHSVSEPTDVGFNVRNFYQVRSSHVLCSMMKANLDEFLRGGLLGTGDALACFASTTGKTWPSWRG